MEGWIEVLIFFILKTYAVCGLFPVHGMRTSKNNPNLSILHRFCIVFDLEEACNLLQAGKRLTLLMVYDIRVCVSTLLKIRIVSTRAGYTSKHLLFAPSTHERCQKDIKELREKLATLEQKVIKLEESLKKTQEFVWSR